MHLGKDRFLLFMVVLFNRRQLPCDRIKIMKMLMCSLKLYGNNIFCTQKKMSNFRRYDHF